MDPVSRGAGEVWAKRRATLGNRYGSGPLKSKQSFGHL